MVIAHFGAGFFREALMLLYQVPNLVLDTSGSNRWMLYNAADLDLKTIFYRTLRAGGACRVVFGTDSSFFPRGFRINILLDQYEAILAAQKKLNFPKEEIDLIFSGNITRLTGFSTTRP